MWVLDFRWVSCFDACPVNAEHMGIQVLNGFDVAASAYVAEVLEHLCCCSAIKQAVVCDKAN
ncbi:hypothetical protein Scep_009074 [Stephania cephalantha]|uniref:Uncharacterized protein n=1 Tax=Stephania cephalantha TaxID=152367 RepID=A0AAP0JSH8_9MAGN